MSPSNRTRTRTLTFVAFASLAALTGCGAEPTGERSLAEQVEAAPLAPIGALALDGPSAATVPISRVLRSPALAEGVAITPTAAVSPEGAGLLVASSPAQTALARSSFADESAASLSLASPARLALGGAPQALSLAATPTLVVGTDACETDADCVPDGCHATSCVAASEMAPGELEGELACTADFRYGTTDGGGCLCHVGHCAALLSAPPQGI